MNREGTCLWSWRQPVYRRHELDTGFGMERENFVLDTKGNDKWQTPRGRIPKPSSRERKPDVNLIHQTAVADVRSAMTKLENHIAETVQSQADTNGTLEARLGAGPSTIK